jgi:aspartyl-tRNA(Asn)/glutamyl-tRNA(Gln) amidotransferase subunit A
MLQTITELGALLGQKKVSPVEITRECLEKIEALNPQLNAFITVLADSAQKEARAAEAEIHRGEWRGPLHGVPVGIKDLIDVAGVRTTAGSALLKGHYASQDAEVVSRLKRAGAVILGKQNLHEFAYGGSSLVSFFGPVHNPWEIDYLAGGSSGGSAAAVATGMGYAAIGTDTAGSIREPAALCGVVGFKPSFGRVSNRGIIPLSVSLDHAGSLTRCVADAAIVLQAIAGHDPGDAGSGDMPVADYTAALSGDAKLVRVGIPRNHFYEDLNPEVAAAMQNALVVLKALVGEIVEVEAPVSTDRRLQNAEAYFYHRSNVERHPELYQAETLRRIRSGEGTTVVELEKARAELGKIRQEIQKTFAEVDVMITPTTPIPTEPIREFADHPERLRPREILMLRNTRPVNVWGLPAVSVPCGFTNGGLPIGLQIIGPHWSEGVVLNVAAAYESATVWHKREPKSLQHQG